MGGTSSHTRDYQSIIAELSLWDKTEDQKYWTTIIQNCCPRTNFIYPSFRLLSEIGEKFPRNFLKLMQSSLEFLEYIDKVESKETLPDIVFDQISQNIWIFTTGVVSMAILEKHRHLYNCLLGDTYDPSKLTPILILPINSGPIPEFPTLSDMVFGKKNSNVPFTTITDAAKQQSLQQQQTHNANQEGHHHQNDMEDIPSGEVDLAIEAPEVSQPADSPTANEDTNNGQENQPEQQETVPEQQQTVPEQQQTVPEQRETVPEQQQTVSEQVPLTSEQVPLASEQVPPPVVQPPFSQTPSQALSVKHDPDVVIVNSPNLAITKNLEVFAQTDDSLVSRFLIVLFDLLLKENYTLLKGTSKFGEIPEESDRINLLRYDIIHNLLVFMNIPFLSEYSIPPIVFPKSISSHFKTSEYVESCFALSAENLRLFNRGTPNAVLNQLVQNMICFFLSITVWNSDFLSAFTEARPDIAVQSFTGSIQLPFSGKLSIDPINPLATENLTFLYVVCMNCPQFVSYIGANEMTNNFIAALLFLSQYMFESVKVSFMHEIIFSTIDCLLTDELSRREINKPCLEQFSCSFRPHRGSFADAIIDFILNVNAKELNKIVCRIVRRILPTSNLSVYSCYKLFKFIEQLPQQSPECFDLIAEGIADAIQNGEGVMNMFVFLLQKRAVFKKNEAKIQKPLFDIINAFMTEAMNLLGKEKISIEAALETLQKIDRSKFCETKVQISKTNYKILYKTWINWTEVLFVNTYKSEQERIQIINLR